MERRGSGGEGGEENEWGPGNNAIGATSCMNDGWTRTLINHVRPDATRHSAKMRANEVRVTSQPEPTGARHPAGWGTKVSSEELRAEGFQRTVARAATNWGAAAVSQRPYCEQGHHWVLITGCGPGRGWATWSGSHQLMTAEVAGEVGSPG